MKRNRFKQDNRGASLLAVLVLMVVVSLIAVVITKITIVNIEMKEVERGTKKNFYSADELMDNLRAGARELAEQSLEKAYADVLENYLTYSASGGDVQKVFATRYMDGLQKQFAENHTDPAVGASDTMDASGNVAYRVSGYDTDTVKSCIKEAADQGCYIPATDPKYEVDYGADELKDLLTLTDASDISYDKDTSQIAFKKDGMQIDFGGIAKGYTSARIMDIFRACGIKSGLVNLGGNVQALGTKKDGSSWRVAVQDPQDTDQYLGVLSIQDKAVITSGGYERYFEQDGRTYHHIIDPKTGYPVENGVISVSIVTADGTLADGLSTSVFIMGKEAATEYWRNHSDEFDMILMTDDREIYVTEGIADSFESEMDTKIIEKKV